MKKLFAVLFISLLFLHLSLPITAQEEQEDYQLPYAGILPDNPLYILKTARDRIISFLISDSVKKAEFNLLQADKRLQSGLQLFERGKEELAEETISKGENYFEEGLKEIEKGKKEGRDVNFLIEKATRSVKKHREVAEGLEKKAQKKKEQFRILLKRIAHFEKTVNMLSPK